MARQYAKKSMAQAHHLILTTALGNTCSCYFFHEKTKAQRVWETCPNIHKYENSDQARIQNQIYLVPKPVFSPYNHSSGEAVAGSPERWHLGVCVLFTFTLDSPGRPQKSNPVLSPLDQWIPSTCCHSAWHPEVSVSLYQFDIIEPPP